MGRLAFSAFLLVFLSSCAGGTPLKTVPVGRNEYIPGLFTVVFFGRHYVEEVDAVVVLDLEGDEYTFSPSAKHKDFEILVNITAAEAFYESGPFFHLHEAFTGKTRLLRIQDPAGQTIGYEIRPIYDPSYYGAEDVVVSEYLLRSDNKVVFKSRPMSRIKMILAPGK